MASGKATTTKENGGTNRQRRISTDHRLLEVLGRKPLATTSAFCETNEANSPVIHHGEHSAAKPQPHDCTNER